MTKSFALAKFESSMNPIGTAFDENIKRVKQMSEVCSADFIRAPMNGGLPMMYRELGNEGIRELATSLQPTSLLPLKGDAQSISFISTP